MRVIVIRITTPDDEGITGESMRQQINDDFNDVGLRGIVEVLSDDKLEGCAHSGKEWTGRGPCPFCEIEP
jgi:hypothetical protein